MQRRHGKNRGRRRGWRKENRALFPQQTLVNSSDLEGESEIEILKREAEAISQQLEMIRQRIGNQKRAKPKKPLTAIVDEKKCTGCGLCYQVCPTGAIFIDRIAEINPRKCTCCQTCIAQCPQGAISIKYLLGE